jgi:hypothetical protein
MSSFRRKSWIVDRHLSPGVAASGPLRRSRSKTVFGWSVVAYDTRPVKKPEPPASQDPLCVNIASDCA